MHKIVNEPDAIKKVLEKPNQIEIYGCEKSLDSLLEKFAGIWEVSAENLVNYRKVWNMYLPKRHPEDRERILNEEWSVAYNPIVAVRKSYPNDNNLPLSELPYFIVILNAGRDNRPKQKSTEQKVEDPLQRNILDKGMIIAEFEDFYLSPNGYPYHHYASLLISKDKNRKQEYPSPGEIEQWMRFSILAKQYVFFNSEHAGASISGRMHAQVVDPEGIRYEDGRVLYPILNDKIMKRIKIKDGIDIVEGYGITALSLKGRDAPYRASLAVRKLRDEHGHWYNIMVNGREVFIVSRNAEKEKSACIGKNCGAYEISGVILVGNIEEPLLEMLDLDRVVDGAVIFSQLSHEQIGSNIANATTGLGGLERYL